MDKNITMTVLEMAACLKIGRNTAYKIVKNGSIPSIRIGRQLRIPVVAFREWLASNGSKPLA